MINRSARMALAAVALTLSVSAASAPALAKMRVAATPFTAPVASAQLAEPQLFVRGTTTLFNPDGIVVTPAAVFVAWQGLSDHAPVPSTIVKYDRQGHVLGSVSLLGRADGLRLNPATNQLWALLNNDGLNGNPKRQPLLYTIDPATLAARQYAFAAVQPHGGGYDDVAFLNGKAYLSASSPTLTAVGANPNPVIVSATLTAAGTVGISPVLYGTAFGYDVVAAKNVRLNISDPDSMAVDAAGDLALVGDNDQEVIIVRSPGSSKQLVQRLPFGTQFDDVAWTSGTSGTLWVADTLQNAVYTVAASFPSGTAFGEGPSGIPVQSFIGTFTGGVVTPLLTQRDGVFSPTSLVFVPTGK